MSSVPAKQIITECKTRGYLAKQLYMISTRPVNGIEPVMANLAVRASSLNEARSIAERDPMHANGARSFTIRPWLVNEGTVTVRLDFATGRFDLS